MKHIEFKPAIIITDPDGHLLDGLSDAACESLGKALAKYIYERRLKHEADQPQNTNDLRCPSLQ